MPTVAAAMHRARVPVAWTTGTGYTTAVHTTQQDNAGKVFTWYCSCGNKSGRWSDDLERVHALATQHVVMRHDEVPEWKEESDMMWNQCHDPACNDPQAHGYSTCDMRGSYEACPAHLECVDPDCAYRRIHLDRIDPLSEEE